MIGQILAGLLLLFLGGDWIVRGAVGMARHLGVSTLVIGLTIVAYGTSSPELFVSVQAALRGHADLAVGNVVGSNISNLLLVLGAAATIYPLAIGDGLARRESVFLGFISVLLLAVAFRGTLDEPVGAMFLVLLAGFSIAVFRMPRVERRETLEARASVAADGDTVVAVTKEEVVEAESDEALQLAREIDEEVRELGESISFEKSIVLLIAGVLLLVIGSDQLILGAVDLARSMGFSEALVGVTIVAVGGSAPELATSLIAAFRRHSDMAIGNIIGSNLFNMLGVLGVTAMVAPLDINSRFALFDIPYMLAVTLIFMLIMLLANTIKRPLGLLFLCAYVAYLVMQFTWLG